MKANRLKLAKELQRTAEAKKEITAEAKCLKKAINKANRCATNHRATDRAAKLVVPTKAHLAKVKPLGITFFLCNKTIKQSN